MDAVVAVARADPALRIAVLELGCGHRVPTVRTLTQALVLQVRRKIGTWKSTPGWYIDKSSRWASGVQEYANSRALTEHAAGRFACQRPRGTATLIRVNPQLPDADVSVAAAAAGGERNPQHFYSFGLRQTHTRLLFH
jgi:hypothetical protein